MKKLPNSYKSGTLVSNIGGGAKITLHFDDVDEAEAWFGGLTAESAEQREQGQAVLQLSELMRGLEIPPTASAFDPHHLFVIGQAIARQAKLATATPPAGVQDGNAGWCKSCGEGVTTFCRGRSETCAIGLKKIQKPTPPAGVPDGWQPIETAPKDGTNILLWWPDQFHSPLTGHFASKWSSFHGWKVSGWGNEPFKTFPTHWMPLPAAPQPAAQTQESKEPGE